MVIFKGGRKGRYKDRARCYGSVQYDGLLLYCLSCASIPTNLEMFIREISILGDLCPARRSVAFAKAIPCLDGKIARC